MSSGTITAGEQHTIDERIHARRWFTLATLCLSLLIIVMDNTILNVAIPSLVRDLGASNSQLQWIVDGYTLVFAGLLLTAGSFGDRRGRKRALRIGIVIFAIGSVLSALAGSPQHLIFTRALMGIGGALIMPSTLSILINVFRDPRERGRAIAIWAGFSGIAVALGPITGGLLLQHFSWSSVFWVNLPISIAALTLGYFFVPESKDPNAPRLDLPGALLSIATLAFLLFAIIEGPDAGWTSASVLGAFAIGLVALGGFIGWELHTDHPMLDLSFFKNPRFSAANTAITLSFFALFGSLFLMTQYWQFVHGYSPIQAGVRLVPYAATLMLTAPLSARLVERVGTKRVVTTGLLVIAGSLFALSFISADSSYLRVILNMCVMSVGMGLTMAPATESVMGSLPREKAGVGSAVNDTTRQVGGALGVAAIGSIVASVYAASVDKAASAAGITGAAAETARDSLGGALNVAASLGDRAGDFATAARDGFVNGLSAGLRLGTAVVLLAVFVAWRFLPARADDPLALDAEHDDDAMSIAGATAVPGMAGAAGS
jgi:EmrB/QacA subfamily drug resistance transporter